MVSQIIEIEPDTPVHHLLDFSPHQLRCTCNPELVFSTLDELVIHYLTNESSPNAKIGLKSRYRMTVNPHTYIAVKGMPKIRRKRLVI